MSAITHETFGLPSTLVAKAVFEQDVNDLLEILAEDEVDVSKLTRGELIEKVREWAYDVIAEDLFNQLSVFDPETGEDLIWGDDSDES